MQLVNMAVTPEEAKEEASESMLGGSAPTAEQIGDMPKYPYGLKICLCEADLVKLGITDLPAIGATMQLQAIVEVCGMRAYKEQDGDNERSLDLQITDMALSMPTKTQEPRAAGAMAKSLYGD